MKWQAFVGHAVFIGSVLLTLVIVASFRLVRRRRQRRSPLHGKKIGHVPGQQLLDRIDKAAFEMVHGLDVMIIALPILFLVWATSRIDWTSVELGFFEYALLLGWLLIFTHGFWKYQRHLRLRDQARDGLLAERVTGMQLNRLVAQGCVVMHDLPCDVGNIDHVVIASRAVYAVETKSFRKPRDAGPARKEAAHQVRFDGQLLHFPGFATREPIEQAARQADWLKRYLRDAAKQDVQVIAAVALPGWYVVQDEAVWRTSAVKVFTPLGEGANFMGKDIGRIAPEYRQLMATALSQLYPITPE